MPTFSNIAGAEPSTVTFRAASVQIVRGTTNEQQEIICLGDPDSSIAIAAILNAAPASTAWGVVTRQVGDSTSIVAPQAGSVWTVTPQAGSTFSVRPLQSSAADLQVTATPAAGSTWAVRPLQSSAADLQTTVTPAAGSTFNVRPLQSSAADLQATVTPAAGSTFNVRPLQSSAADLQATATQGGVWSVRTQDGSGNAIESAIASPSTAQRGFVVRPVVNGIASTTVLITSTNSTALYSLISSVAGAKQKVFAYFVGSTHTSPSTLVFMSSNVIDRWAVNFGSGSSGITGANLAVGSPSWLFETDAGNALNCRVEGGSSAASTVVVRISLAWRSEA